MNDPIREYAIFLYRIRHQCVDTTTFAYVDTQTIFELTLATEAELLEMEMFL